MQVLCLQEVNSLTDTAVCVKDVEVQELDRVAVRVNQHVKAVHVRSMG